MVGTYSVVKPVLDESAFGVPDAGSPRYAFYLVTEGGKATFLTARSEPRLVVVTKGQAKSWGGSEARCYDLADPSATRPGHAEDE